MNASLPTSPACDRNKGPIVSYLRTALAGARTVLEVGSGTGQHAVHFAAALPHLSWQPTDVPENQAMLRARFAVEAPKNLLAPLVLDLHATPWPAGPYDAVFTANTLHIVDWSGVEAFFRGVGHVLPAGGTLCVYGPFRYRGEFTTPSNAAFDADLRARDPASGIRDFEKIAALAGAEGLALVADHSMPANNQLLHFRRAAVPARTVGETMG
jgi:SAM-dependent methyltransferase